MKALFVAIMIFSGCAFFQEAQNPDTLPQLVYRTALPAVPADWAMSRPRIEVLFHVSKIGSVTDVRFVNSPGDNAWESGALEEMKKWQFLPALVGQDSVPVWVRVPIIVRFTDFNVLNLAQLVFTDQASADSAYQLLLAGHPFETIVQELSSTWSGMYEKSIGKTDIGVYSGEIRRELKKLRDNQFTKPIRLGNSLVIFKRLPKNPVSGV